MGIRYRFTVSVLVATTGHASVALAEPALFIGGDSESSTTLVTPSTEAPSSVAFSMHVEAAAAMPIGAEKAAQFGWGGVGTVTGELALHPVFGIELGIGALVLSDGGGADPEGVAPTEVGIGAFGTLGPRVRPLATLSSNDGPFGLDGLWAAGGFGAAITGGELRPAIRASLGWDVMSRTVSAGPFVGYLQVVEPDDGSLRPEDLRAVVFGLHGSFGPPSRRSAESEIGDADGDGIVDTSDVCPEVAEDKDGFSDDDGCPDLDNDKDGIPDAKDACRDEAEDVDGFEDEDGCPDLDNDKDGVPDAKDTCLNAAEDLDGVEDEDGCAEEDGDRDGVPDAVDACPSEPESNNGIRDNDGCPDTSDLHVVGDRIVLDERVQFSNDSATLTDASVPLLERVALFLNEHPEYAVVRVAGHTDATGPDDYNLKLSASRALSVREMLVKKGVPPTRFRVMAFGETRPLDPAHIAPEDKENRRVEFEIVERRKRQP